jgi:hypothetical protein
VMNLVISIGCRDPNVLLLLSWYGNYALHNSWITILDGKLIVWMPTTCRVPPTLCYFGWEELGHHFFTLSRSEVPFVSTVIKEPTNSNWLTLSWETTQGAATLFVFSSTLAPWYGLVTKPEVQKFRVWSFHMFSNLPMDLLMSPPLP